MSARCSVPLLVQPGVHLAVLKKNNKKKKWRPVALLCTDYKVLPRALSNQLKDFLGIVANADQTCCVLERTVMDNIVLIRNVFDISKYHDVNFVSLDQQAFDWVDHCYMHKGHLAMFFFFFG